MFFLALENLITIITAAIRKDVSVESISGAPRIAPVPTGTVAEPERNAITGSIDSGRAVPVAANNEPVVELDKEK